MAVAEPERARINFGDVCLRVGGLGGDCGKGRGIGERTIGMSSRGGPGNELSMGLTEL